MSPSTDQGPLRLITPVFSLGGTKVDRARAWEIPILNHTWLEDCFASWKNIPIGGIANTKYSHFPRAVNFMEILGEKGFTGFKKLNPAKILGEDPNQVDIVSSGSTSRAVQQQERPVNGSSGAVNRPLSPPVPIPLPAPSVVNKSPVRPPPTAPSTSHTPRSNGFLKANGTTPRGNGTRPELLAQSSKRPTPTPRSTKHTKDAMDIDAGPGAPDMEMPPQDAVHERSPSPVPPPKSKPIGAKQRLPLPRDDSDDDLDRELEEGLIAITRPTIKAPSKPANASSLTKSSTPAGSTNPRASTSTAGPSGESSRAPRPAATSTIKFAPVSPLTRTASERSPKASPRPATEINSSPLKRTTTAPSLSTGKNSSAKPASKQINSSKGKGKQKESSSEAEDDTPDAESSRSSVAPGARPRRGAAARAEAKLRDEVMPDVLKYEKSMKASQGDIRKLALSGDMASKKRSREEESGGEGEARRSSLKKKTTPAPAPKKGKSRAVTDEEDESESSSDEDGPPPAKIAKKTQKDGWQTASATPEPAQKVVIMTTQYELEDAQKVLAPAFDPEAIPNDM